MNSSKAARKQASRLVEIDRGRPLSLHLPVGAAVHCVLGEVWLTQEGLSDDIVLAAREKFDVQQRGLILVSGIGGSALVYVDANGSGERANGTVTSRFDFLDAARIRAAELRRAEIGRIASVAWTFMVRLVKQIRAALQLRPRAVQR